MSQLGHMFSPERFRYNQRALLTSRIAPLAQLDRASGYEPEGREFESLRAHHFSSTEFKQLATFRLLLVFGRFFTVPRIMPTQLFYGRQNGVLGRMHVPG